MFEFIFWVSVIMIFYAYFGYPLLLILILGARKIKNAFNQKASKMRSNTDSATNDQFEPYNVSFIITAYNEQEKIEEKIKNTLLQDYPKEKLEIIVASDCSSDRTDQIAESYSAQGVKLVRAQERKGKENAQKLAVDASKGEILVFSDVATILKTEALRNIVKNFDDQTVGCVSSEDRFIDKDGNVSGEGAYVKYEMYLRSLETRVNTLVGLSGSFFAARKTVCNDWAVDLQSDFNTLLNSIKIGLRGISDKNSIGYYHNIADETKEFQRKVRTVTRGISVLMRNLYLLNFKEFGFFSWQLFSHKICRWMVPFLMALALMINAIIVFNSGRLILMLILQMIFYSTAFYYYLTEVNGRNGKNSKTSMKYSLAYAIKPISRLCYFFLAVNYAILVAWFNYIKGNRATFWEPSKR